MGRKIQNTNGESGMNWIGVRYPLSYEQIKAVERELDVNLPEDYCIKIGKINGGALSDAYIMHQTLGEISYSRNVSLSKKSRENIFTLYGIVSDEHNRLFPFGSVGDGDYFCFDLKNQNVVLWMHEMDAIEYICDSFTDLLQMIREL